MKKLGFVLGILFLSFFGFNISFAYDICEPYSYNNPNPTLPCSYNGYDYDSLAVEAGINSFFYRGSEYALFDNSWWWSLISQTYETCDGLMVAWGNYYCSHNLSFNKSGALFFGPGASFGKMLTIVRDPQTGGGVSDYPTGENIYCGINGYTICQSVYTLNTQVTLDAYPNEGYAFSHWEINDLSMADADGSIDISMTEDKVVKAVFYLKADDFVFPVLAEGVTNPLQNKFNPIGDGWHGNGVGDNVQGAGDGHLGQDYIMSSGNGDENSSGEPVYAVANGTIVEVINNQNTSYGWCDSDDHGWGPVVVVRHENRDGFNTTGSIVTTSCNTETSPTLIYSLYGHLSKASIQNLQIGQSVVKGQQLGVIGAYGVDQNSWTTNHLHFEIKDEVGYTEGTWYKTPANEGVCPESTNYSCGSYLIKGVGTAYSMGSTFAPHRYESGAFINLNKQ